MVFAGDERRGQAVTCSVLPLDSAANATVEPRSELQDNAAAAPPATSGGVTSIGESVARAAASLQASLAAAASASGWLFPAVSAPAPARPPSSSLDTESFLTGGRSLLDILLPSNWMGECAGPRSCAPEVFPSQSAAPSSSAKCEAVLSDSTPASCDVDAAAPHAAAAYSPSLPPALAAPASTTSGTGFLDSSLPADRSSSYDSLSVALAEAIVASPRSRARRAQSVIASPPPSSPTAKPSMLGLSPTRMDVGSPGRRMEHSPRVSPVGGAGSRGGW